MARGSLSEKVKIKSKELFGEEITREELRLLPYIQYVMMNEQIIDTSRINGEERDILRKWKTAGYMEGGASGLAITKEFWDKMNEVLFIAYIEQAD